MVRRIAFSLVAAGMVMTSFTQREIGDPPAKQEKVKTMHVKIESADTPLRKQDYTCAFWLNGFRKEAGDTSANIFAITSGRYGFSLDAADFRRVCLGRIEGEGYLAAISTGSEALKNLPKTELEIEIEHKGTVYRAVNCLAGRQKNMRQVLLMESGRFAQRYQFLGLQFKDATGKVLETDSMFELAAWPSTLTFNVRVAPDLAYAAGPSPGVVGTARTLRGKCIDVAHNPKMESANFTLETWVYIPSKLSHHNRRNWLVGKNKNEWADGCFGLVHNHGAVTAVMNIGGGRQNAAQVQVHNALKENEWCHLAMSYDGTTLKLYVNGRERGKKKIGKPRTLGRDRLRIGGRPDGYGAGIHAVFDELRIWNRALNPKEIMAHKRTPGKFARSGLSWQMNFDDGAASKANPNLDGAVMRVSLNGRKVEKRMTKWGLGAMKEITLHCPMSDEQLQTDALAFSVTGTKGAKYKTKYAPTMAAHVVDVPSFQRDWKTGYTDIRKYDELDIKIENKSAARQYAPVLFDVKKPASITGQVPMLCYPDGRPTGIPVQLSKNWHSAAYSKFYAILPLAPGANHYRLRIAYGFWGKLPSASHAQLCLYGWGNNGRWDQMAIGCWGETMCFDVDNSCTPVMITDVRMLMARNGLNGKKWSWTDAGWGGDWICVNRSGANKLMPTEFKTAYLAHGPCLTDVRYNGYYGKNRDFSIDARLATLRTDDYSRVFQQFRYRFNKPLSTARSYLFKQGRTGSYATPVISYGNRDGLIAEHKVPGGLRVKSMFKKDIVLTGPGPWWVSFTGARKTDGKNWGTGYRALVIRSFKAVHGGKEYRNPTIAFPVFQAVKKENLSNLDLYLTVPKGVKKFMPGDTVDMDLEWITLHRIADDYYGPNEAYRKHLAANPKSWKTTHREAVGNDLKVTVAGGKLLNSYPVIIAANGSEVKVGIKGGVGCVPIRFEGLRSNTFKLYRVQGGSRKALDQSVNGNDFWQTDYDAESNTYKMTFNLPLDGVKESTWLLAR